MTRGVVATPHQLATAAAADVLRDGGNAADACIAANAVLCVVYPHMTSLGGDLSALVWPPGAERPVGLLGIGPAGSRADLGELRTGGLEAMPSRGAVTVTVPGTAHAWGSLAERFGSQGLPPLLEPAAALAQEGFLVTPGLARALAENAGWLTREPAAAALYPPLKAGMLMRNPDLATTLRALGRRGAGVFYGGEVGEAIVAALDARGGLLAPADLTGFRAEWVAPLALEWQDLTVYELPPPTQGLAALGMLARVPPRGEATSPGPPLANLVRRLRDTVHPLRDGYISDPRFAAVPTRPFLDPGWAEPGPAAAGAPGDTVYLCCADETGLVVSLIQSVAFEFGSGVVAPTTGVLLQNRGAYFSLDPAHVNRIAPGKRTMHTLIPALAARAGRPWAAFGTMGADAQPQIQLQVLLRLAAGEPPDAAVAAPRVRVDLSGTRLGVESDYPGAAEIAREVPGGYLMPPRDSFFGHAQALTLAGRWSGGADPRADGAVAVV